MESLLPKANRDDEGNAGRLSSKEGGKKITFRLLLRRSGRRSEGENFQERKVGSGTWAPSRDEGILHLVIL